jgi:hypothetical protein
VQSSHSMREGGFISATTSLKARRAFKCVMCDSLEESSVDLPTLGREVFPQLVASARLERRQNTQVHPSEGGAPCRESLEERRLATIEGGRRNRTRRICCAMISRPTLGHVTTGYGVPPVLPAHDARSGCQR